MFRKLDRTDCFNQLDQESGLVPIRNIARTGGRENGSWTILTAIESAKPVLKTTFLLSGK
jgi:hypothetical protein